MANKDSLAYIWIMAEMAREEIYKRIILDEEEKILINKIREEILQVDSEINHKIKEAEKSEIERLSSLIKEENNNYRKNITNLLKKENIFIGCNWEYPGDYGEWVYYLFSPNLGFSIPFDGMGFLQTPSSDFEIKKCHNNQELENQIRNIFNYSWNKNYFCKENIENWPFES